ncbi:MAG: hypothetical protein ABIJ56_01685 [Pseudomonadota bacterium]
MKTIFFKHEKKIPQKYFSAGSYTVNRIHALNLDAHPAVLCHNATYGEDVKVSGWPLSTFDDGGCPGAGQNGLFRLYVDEWVDAGRP